MVMGVAAVVGGGDGSGPAARPARIPAGLVLLVGGPGSGKTAFARELAGQGRLDQAALVSTDDIAAEPLAPDAVPAERDRRVAARLSAGRTVVVDPAGFDQGFTTPEVRGRLLALAARFGAPVFALCFGGARADLPGVAAVHPVPGRAEGVDAAAAAARFHLVESDPERRAVTRARAVAITADGKLLLIRREVPGEAVFWVLPGGGIEQTDASVEAAVLREVREETGGDFTIHGLVEFADTASGRHAIFVGRIEGHAEELRSGPELTSGRGVYRLDAIPLTRRALGGLKLWPQSTHRWLLDLLGRGADPFSLPDLRRHGPALWTWR